MQHRHCKNLLDRGFEPHQCHKLTGQQIDHADATSSLVFRQPLSDRDSTENSAFTNLRQPDERKVSDEIDPSRKPGQLHDRLVLARLQINQTKRPRS